jgi:hypothetical protein
MFWKYYFRLLVLLFVTSLIAGFTGVGSLQLRTLFDVFDRVLDGVSLLGLYGYAWKRPAISRSFWKAFVPFYGLWAVFMVTMSSSRITANNLPEAILTAPFIIPLYYALFRYAFHAPQTEYVAARSERAV